MTPQTTQDTPTEANDGIQIATWMRLETSSRSSNCPSQRIAKDTVIYLRTVS